MRTLLACLIFFVPLSAHAIGAAWPITDNPRFWVLGEGLFHMAFDGYYFGSSANYDGTGQVNIPAGMGSVKLGEVRAHGAFGFGPRVSVFAQLEYRAVNETLGSGAPANVSNGSNKGFGDTFIGLRGMVYRSRATDRIYPTEWSPDTFVIIAEGTWTFPFYDTAAQGLPPLGDQSNDLSAIGRMVWYTNEWLGLSLASGYIYRTAGYAHEVPISLRADASLQERYKVRFWTEFQSIQRVSSSGIALNTAQTDPFPNGSFLFKSFAPIIRTGTLGVAYLVTKKWELAAAGIFTATGNNAAKGYGLNIGLAWRPYQVPEVKFEEYRQEQIARLKGEKRDFRRKDVARYGFRATIVKVSTQGNFVKILYGEKDRVRVGDNFYVVPPMSMHAESYRPVASATVVQVQPNAAFLHIDERFQPDVMVKEGFETRRVYFDNE